MLDVVSFCDIGPLSLRRRCGRNMVVGPVALVSVDGGRNVSVLGQRLRLSHWGYCVVAWYCVAVGSSSLSSISPMLICSSEGVTALVTPDDL